MSNFIAATRNVMLDAITPNLMSLHNGDPGASGTDNELSGGGYTRESCSFSAAAGGVRALAADVDFTGTAAATVSHIGLWNSSGPTFLGWLLRSGGDSAFNAAGEYSITTDTVINLDNDS
jgi:hypothetical protein